jgi:hypothetical protein
MEFVKGLRLARKHINAQIRELVAERRGLHVNARNRHAELSGGIDALCRLRGKLGVELFQVEERLAAARKADDVA